MKRKKERKTAGEVYEEETGNEEEGWCCTEKEGLMTGRGGGGREYAKSVDNKRFICKEVCTVRGAREQVLVAALGT